MKQFKQISCADNPGLPDWALNQLENYSQFPINKVTGYPKTNEEIIAYIGNADCALVSWNTPIDKEVIDHCPNLKYIGMCCSLIDEDAANVDVRYARSKGIEVKGVRDYGDEGVIEFIISELIRLLKGNGTYQWKSDQVELGSQKLGIVGMGTTGLMLAQAARFFGMEVYYFSRTQKEEINKQGIKFLELEQLLSTVDILSFHLPKNTKILNNENFETFGNGKIIINTTLELPFEKEDFIYWLQQADNYAIMDGVAMGVHAQELTNTHKMIYSSKTSGFTKEAKDRLAQKVIDNVQSTLEELNTANIIL